jgi:hypothetical protein
MFRICDPKHALVLCLASLIASCRGEPRGEVEGLRFVRCAQIEPLARSYQVRGLELRVEERTLRVRAATPLQIAAFTGPVGRAFTDSDLAQLGEGELALWLGGLGDTEALARDNLARLAARKVPTLFVAGGADRWPVIQAAFAALPEDAPIVQGSGLRVLELGKLRLGVVAGAEGGRYAIDEQGCGLTPEDRELLRTEAGPVDGLLSWQLPPLPSSPDRTPVGLFAFPESQPPRAQLWGVPRLGAPGTLRGDGARLKSQVRHFLVGADGLQPRP